MRTPAERRSTRALALLGLLAAACEPGSDAGGRPVVAVSVVPQAWLVERLAGDAVEVVVIVPPGASPASWEPTLVQRRALDEARLYVKVGHPHFPFERTWLAPLLRGRADVAVIDASGGAADPSHDPHLWLSAEHMGALVGPLVEALVALAPGREAAIRANGASTRTEIEATGRRVADALASARGKTFVVLHPSWGWLAREHGLEQLAIQHENREPDPRRLAALIDRARALGIEVVFTQPHFDAASARVVAREIGARVEALDPLARAWPENLVRMAERIAAEAR